jgi:hypothetical protein
MPESKKVYFYIHGSLNEIKSFAYFMIASQKSLKNLVL